MRTGVRLLTPDEVAVHLRALLAAGYPVAVRTASPGTDVSTTLRIPLKKAADGCSCDDVPLRRRWRTSIRCPKGTKRARWSSPARLAPV
jgi:hypothetical protein